MSDTIYALASGPPPSGIAVIRVSGPETRFVLETMAGGLANARQAVVREIRNRAGEIIDRGICIWFPGPNSFTGEDTAEFQLHGGRAVISAMLDSLAELSGLRLAEAGEFTRRAFEHGRMGLTEVEGLADLVRAETDRQRRQALAVAGGALHERLERWRQEILTARAAIEAALDFADEDDIPDDVSERAWRTCGRIGSEINAFLDDGHRGEIVRDGFNVVLMGPPNAGKSSLLNALARRDIAIVTPEPGTTRDVLECWLDIGGFAVRVSDTAGIRETTGVVESEGIRRARGKAKEADLVIWLSAVDDPHPPVGLEDAGAPVWVLRSKDDTGGFGPDGVSVVRDGGLASLTARLEEFLGSLGGAAESVGVTRHRHREGLERCAALLRNAASDDGAPMEVRAEWLRQAGESIGRLTGRIDVEEVLGSIFSEFCIGK